MSGPTFLLPGVVRAGRDAYEDFNGPIDLILFLLSKNKIEIRDIKISALLTQYLTFLEEMKRLDLEIASEFLAMASHLVYLKSRMLLSLSDEQAQEEMDEFLQAIEQRRREEEYRRVVFGRDFLTRRAELAGHVFFRRPEVLERVRDYPHTHRPDELIAALTELSDRVRRRSPPNPFVFEGIVGHETFSLGDMISRVLTRLARFGRTTLGHLIRRARSRAERVTIFLAVLELCRGHKLTVGDRGDDYDLTATGPADGMAAIPATLMEG